MRRSLLLGLSAIVIISSGACGSAATGMDAGDSGTPPDAGDAGDAGGCVPGGGGGYLAAPYPNLSDYCLVANVDGGIVPLAGVMPYSLNVPFFADYAIKARTVWVPPGSAATYGPQNVFTFPNGTIFTKSFGWPDDARKASPNITWVETRVEMFVDGGWQLYPYVWNDAGTDATLSTGGQTVDLSFLNLDGGLLTAAHLIPSGQQCLECHQSLGHAAPIGAKARQLNGAYVYPDGVTANQLDVWVDAGILSGAPPAASAPALPIWNDPDAGTVQARALAYLEGNCAHCHNPDGYSASVGLDFWVSDQSAANQGICVAPTLAYFGTSDAYDVVPGDPNGSMLFFLIQSTQNGALMPPIGRSLEDIAGATLISSWITELDGGVDGGCSVDGGS